jgi:hypothetical protein
MHVFVVPADGGSPRALTSGTWSVGGGNELRASATIEWTPDGRSILFEGLRDTDAERKVSDVADLRGRRRHRRDSRRGRRPGRMGPPGGVARRTRDRVHRLPRSRKTHTVSDLYVMPHRGGAMKKISGDLDRDPQHPALGGRRERRLLRRAGSRLAERVLRRYRRRRAEAGITRHADPDARLRVEGSRRRRHRHRLPASAGRRQIQPEGRGGDHEADRRERRPARGQAARHAEEIWYTSTNNAKVHGWIVKPPAFDPSKKYPLILEIHGGPFSMYTVGFNYMWQNFAANDFVVLYTNPRGSTGTAARSRTASTTTIRTGLRRPDGGRRHRRRQGLRRSDADVRLGLQRRRRAFELGHRPHQPLRGRRPCAAR